MKGSKIPLPLWLLIILGLILLISNSTLFQARQKIEIGEFYQYLKNGEISKIEIQESIIRSGEFKTGKIFVTHIPLSNLYDLYPDSKNILQEKIAKGEIKLIFTQPSWLAVILPHILPLILLFAFLFLLFRLYNPAGGQRSPFDFAKSRARLFLGQGRVNITFADVAGVEEAKQELQEIVEFLKNPEKFRVLGAKIPRGVLLMGPPGTGKTLLAKAVAGEAEVPFFSISGSEFVEMFVGVGAARVRDLFDQAKRNAPCIVFVDEIDAVGRHRGAGLGGGHDEREQTLNQILVEMDGFDERTNVIVLAGTNRPDILDPALLRPGRFDRHVILDMPDTKARQAILKIHAKGKPFDPSIDQEKLLEEVARQTPGFSGADLANLLNEAAILAGRANKAFIGMQEIAEAVDRVIAGPQRKSKAISQKEKEIMAYHEAGHALVGWVLPKVDPVHKISIIARGRIGGFTRFLQEEDRYLLTKSQLEENLAAALGGRVAEELIFGEPSTGAESDLERVRDFTWKMVTRFGMGEGLPPMALGKIQEMIFLGKEISEQRDYGPKVAKKIDEAKERIVTKAYKTSQAILNKYKDKLHEIAKKLIETESIEGEELEKLFEGVPKNQWES